MTATDPITGTAYEDSDPFLMARVVVNVAGEATNLLQSQVGTIAYRVWDRSAEVTDGDQPLTVADVVYDTLQTGSVWTADATGYNFAFTLPAACLPEGNKTYRVQVAFTLTGGGAFPVVWHITTARLVGS